MWLCIIITVLMTFFRPAVLGLMVMGIASYYIGKRINKKNPKIIMENLRIHTTIVQPKKDYSAPKSHNVKFNESDEANINTIKDDEKPKN